MTAIGLDSVRRVPAPSVEFPALIEADQSHLAAVTSQAGGESRLAAVTSFTTVRGGDTVAVVREVGPPGHGTSVLAPSPGRWRPIRHLRESVWPGDTLGFIQDRSHLLAVGRVEDPESGQIHPGDSALVIMGPPNPLRLSGRVERVDGRTYGADVRVEFRPAGRRPAPNGLVTVTIFPSGPGDSVLAAPANAVCLLSIGPAVFVAESPGHFTVRFVKADVHDAGVSLIHEGLDGPVAVATSGLAPLIAAAEDAIASQEHRGK